MEEKQVIYSNSKKATDEELIESYSRTNSVWKTGDEFGMRGQNVHARLTKLGIIHKMRYWTEKENEFLKQNYLYYRDKQDLKLLSEIMGRTTTFLSRKAKALGLTSNSRPFDLSDEKRIMLSERQKENIRINGHPKWMLGKKHSEEFKKEASVRSKNNWADEKFILNSNKHRQELSDRMSIMQASGKLTNNYSRCKNGTITVGGKTIFVRSSWEANIACYFEMLKSNNEIKDWQYEPTVFWFLEIKRGVRSYKPDFLIINKDGSKKYVEVKGWMDAKSKTKLNRMRIYYPDIKIELLDSKRYNEIKKYSSVIPNWGILDTNKEEYIKCSIDGCDNKSHSKNLCRKHFYKIYKK